MDFLRRLESLRTYQRHQSKFQRAIAICGVCALALLTLYILPTVLEAVTVPYLGIWLSCSVFGDVAGCICLYFLGSKREAMSLYLWSKVGELLLFEAHLLSPESLLWVTDLLPVIVCSDLLISKVFLARDEWPGSNA